MYLRSIKVSNFKSFNVLETGLSRFNVIIGPNAAGKSNFIRVFRFIRDLLNRGVDNAVSLQGGKDYLRNINLLNDNKNFSITITARPDDNDMENYRFEKINSRLKEISYSLTLTFRRQGTIRVIDDAVQFLFVNIKDNSNINYKVYNKNGELKTDASDKYHKDIYAMIAGSRYKKKMLIDEPVLASSEVFLFPVLKQFRHLLQNITIYDFDTKMPQKATQFVGPSDLDESGENLAIVLKRIFRDNEKRRMFFNLLNDLIPYIDNLEVGSFIGRYRQVMMEENFSRIGKLPSSMMSDGTIFVIQLLTALYFEEKPFAVFEEAGRRIHPNLISKIIDMMKDCSSSKQIILSTHNPEIVKYSGADNLLFVSRDKEGYSKITRPHEKEEIMTFLKNEIGIEELFISNLLGG